MCLCHLVYQYAWLNTYIYLLSLNLQMYSFIPWKRFKLTFLHSSFLEVFPVRRDLFHLCFNIKVYLSFYSRFASLSLRTVLSIFKMVVFRESLEKIKFIRTFKLIEETWFYLQENHIFEGLQSDCGKRESVTVLGCNLEIVLFPFPCVLKGISLLSLHLRFTLIIANLVCYI